MTETVDNPRWVRWPEGEVREYTRGPDGVLVVRVALDAPGEGRAAFRALYRIARTIARERGLGRVSPEAVAHTMRFTEDKLRLHFYVWSGFGSGVLA